MAGTGLLATSTPTSRSYATPAASSAVQRPPRGAGASWRSRTTNSASTAANPVPKMPTGTGAAPLGRQPARQMGPTSRSGSPVRRRSGAM